MKKMILLILPLFLTSCAEYKWVKQGASDRDETVVETACEAQALRDLPPEDRITPIVGMLQGVVEKGGDLRVEVADTNESKELMKFCRKFTVPLRAALREAGVLTNYETPKRPVVHVFFIAPGCCYTGYSFSNNN